MSWITRTTLSLPSQWPTFECPRTLIESEPTENKTYEIQNSSAAIRKGIQRICAGLPGCCSHGTTEKEAIENIKDTIRISVGLKLALEQLNRL